MTTIAIDPNVRLNDGTYSGFEDILSGEVPELGDRVDILEVESGLHGEALVAGIDSDKRIIYLDVKWAELEWGDPEPW